MWFDELLFCQIISGRIEWKGNHVMQGIRTTGNHYQPVHSQRNTGTIRQSGLQCRQQPFIHTDRLEIVMSATFEVVHEPCSLFSRVSQFIKSIRQLNTIQIGLETGSHRRCTGTQTSQGSLTGRIIPARTPALRPVAVQ